MRKNLEEIKRGWEDFQRAATVGFAAASGAITNFVQQASPAHWETLTGSISLLAGSISTRCTSFCGRSTASPPAVVTARVASSTA
jgi:hypothetical protein